MHTEVVDNVLVGAGIMSATLAAFLKELDPDATVQLFESLGAPAVESSSAWNNAGTGHAALCELNYTPEGPDGTLDIKRAVDINTSFEVSKQFWSYLLGRSILKCSEFIHSVPHMTFCQGEDDRRYLKLRFEKMRAHPCFSEMVYTEDLGLMGQWAPLVAEGRSARDTLTMTRFDHGTDVNFGLLARQIIGFLQGQQAIEVHYRHKVTELNKRRDGLWHIVALCKDTGEKKDILSKFVFIGAGGGAFTLLKKSGIPEGRLYSGFPVSGQWLRCRNLQVVARHQAKVYSKAAIGAPPMSVPHLDTRIVDGKKSLLFGPFAGFSTKFLKYGSPFDMPRSVELDNIIPMLSVARDNFPLIRYLIGQVLQTRSQRLEALKALYPDAADSDWTLETAGQRVQIIKKDSMKGAVLKFGTELVVSADKSLAALLGASPGASTSVSIILKLMGTCFPGKFTSALWQQKLAEMIPVSAPELAHDAQALRATRKRTAECLGLTG